MQLLQSMKYQFLIIFSLILCLSTKTDAQELRFGFNVNPSINWLSADNQNIESDGVRFGFKYGLILDYKFGENERYAITTGAGVNLAGGKLKGTTTGTDSVGVLSTYSSSFTPKIQYLEIPINLKLRSNEVGYITYYGQLGLINAFRIRQRAKYSYDDILTGSNVEVKNDKIDDTPFYPNNIKKASIYNLGLAFEVGMEYALTENTYFIAGIYFNNGFTNILVDGDKERVVMRTIGLNLGVLF